MRSPTLAELPLPLLDKTGWPWTEESPQLPDTMPDGSPWPRISIVTPSYNQGQFIEETIRSVLLQGYPNLEYIIIDGGSTDDSVEIIKKYEPWLAYWVSESDRGQSHAINKGWKKSTGEVVAYLNSDDIYFPYTFKKIALEFRQNDNAGLFVGAIAATDGNSQVLNINYPKVYGNTPCDLTILEPSSWYLPQAASFFSRTALEKIGFWVRENLHFTMDRELLYRLVHEYQAHLVQDVLATYRHHAEGKTTAEVAKSFMETNKSYGYCQWGSEADKKQREKIKKKRLSNAYYYQGKTAHGIVGYKSLLNAAILNPDFLRNMNFYKIIIKKLLKRMQG